MIALGLCHADIDREIGCAGELNGVVERDAPAPVVLWQPIETYLAVKPAAFEDNSIARQQTKVYLSGHNIGFDFD